MTERTDGREANGFFAPGNRIWQTRSRAGVRPKFETADDLQAAVDEYIAWVDENPFISRKIAPGKGVVQIPLNRPPTIQGFCAHYRMGKSTWHSWADANNPNYRPDLLDVIEAAETLFEADHIDGGMVGDYNANLTARITGLTEKSEVDNKSSDGSMTPKSALDLSKLSEAELEQLDQIAAKAGDTEGTGEA